MEKNESNGDLWRGVEANPPMSYINYFNFERRYLEKKLDENDIVLDIGCGDGRSILPLAEYVKTFYGIDNDKNEVKKARKNLQGLENIDILNMDAEDMIFKDKFFHKIFIGLTFCNFHNSKNKILQEIRRILKDEGKFIFSVFNEDALEERLGIYKRIAPYHIKLDNKGTFYFPTQNVYSQQFSQEEISDIVTNQGFKINDIQKGEIFYMLNCTKN